MSCPRRLLWRTAYPHQALTQNEETRCRLHTALRAFLSLAICAAAAPALAVVTLDDPGNFQVKNTFSATSLGIPGPLAGLLFSADGNLLYVVGASETPTSALYGVPVTRDPLTGDVTGLGLAAAVTKVFDGTAATPGLDAGFEIGPGGTLFYTYWSSNRLGERPGGVTGAETQFNMGTVGVPSSVAGMTFSPHRTDPGTGFGMMQVSSWQGANLYEVPLTSAGAGIFTPGAVTLFVTLPQQGTGAIQYVPSGPLAGNLMYVNYNFGEVRLLTIDAATGLPVDKTSGLPTLGTANPTDSRFASGLGVGPWGLEFDPRTNDFFVATFRGDPANSIVQIGGAGFPPPSTTASTTTTITTTTTPTSTRRHRPAPRRPRRWHRGAASGRPPSRRSSAGWKRCWRRSTRRRTWAPPRPRCATAWRPHGRRHRRPMTPSRLAGRSPPATPSRKRPAS